MSKYICAALLASALANNDNVHSRSVTEDDNPFQNEGEVLKNSKPHDSAALEVRGGASILEANAGPSVTADAADEAAAAARNVADQAKNADEVQQLVDFVWPIVVNYAGISKMLLRKYAKQALEGLEGSPHDRLNEAVHKLTSLFDAEQRSYAERRAADAAAAADTEYEDDVKNLAELHQIPDHVARQALEARELKEGLISPEFKFGGQISKEILLEAQTKEESTFTLVVKLHGEYYEVEVNRHNTIWFVKSVLKQDHDHLDFNFKLAFKPTSAPLFKRSYLNPEAQFLEDEKTLQDYGICSDDAEVNLVMTLNNGRNE